MAPGVVAPLAGRDEVAARSAWSACVPVAVPGERGPPTGVSGDERAPPPVAGTGGSDAPPSGRKASSRSSVMENPACGSGASARSRAP
jgi:hypothetical protein